MPKKSILHTDWPLLKLSLVLFFLVTTALVFTKLVYFSDTQSALVNDNIRQLQQQSASISQDYKKIQTNYEDALYELQLQQIEQQKLEESKKQIEKAYNELKSTESGKRLDTIDKLYEKYQDTVKKIERNKAVNIDTTEIEDSMNDWGLSFLDKKYDELDKTFDDTLETLDKEYEKYLASLPTPTPTPVPRQVLPAVGYSYQLVSTPKGVFSTYLIKLPLSKYAVKTVTANSSDCTNNCPAKPLHEYIAENHAYAGMNGTYFCPPDYSSCVNKTYSFDFAVYNSNLHKWINESSLSWNGLGLAAFNGATPLFLNESKSYAGQPVTAGIVNFPSLLSAGQITVNPAALNSYQADVRGTRGAIGTDGSNIYLALISSATVPDAAYVLKALGATYALNIDGGGSSAMYIAGSYRVGPGRLLPNAIVIVPR